MKENLFEMLLSLFEKSLAQIRKKDNNELNTLGQPEEILDEEFDLHRDLLWIKMADESSSRVFTQDERVKLTKSSYQFLTRMKLWGIIDSRVFELIINQLQFSDSRIVTLEETKWTIRNILADTLDTEQLAFLDLVLYRKDDQYRLH